MDSKLLSDVALAFVAREDGATDRAPVGDFYNPDQSALADQVTNLH